MSASKDTRPEAESFQAAATDLKDKIVDAGTYVKDRLTASPTGASSGTGTAGTTAGEGHAENAKVAKEDAKHHAQAAADRAGDSVKEAYNSAGDKAQEKKQEAKEAYDKNITDKIATNPIEESRAQGEIPANTEAVKTVYGQK